jgi:hypothetical protein
MRCAAVTVLADRDACPLLSQDRFSRSRKDRLLERSTGSRQRSVLGRVALRVRHLVIRRRLRLRL